MELNLLTKLREFGLNSYETKLWVGLLSVGVSTVGELSDIANVPRSRSYDVLKSLREKGFVTVEKGKPIKYKPTNPEEVIKNTKERVMKKAKKRIKLIDNLKTKDIFLGLEKIHKQSSDLNEPNEFVGFFRDKTNIKNQLQYMLKNAKKFVYIIETKEGISKNITFLTKILSSLEKKDIDVRVMAGIGKNFSRGRNKIKIKNTKLGGGLYIVDGEKMLFMLFDNHNIGILTNTKSFIKSVTGLFNKQWGNSSFVD